MGTRTANHENRPNKAEKVTTLPYLWSDIFYRGFTFRFQAEHLFAFALPIVPESEGSKKGIKEHAVPIKKNILLIRLREYRG